MAASSAVFYEGFDTLSGYPVKTNPCCGIVTIIKFVKPNGKGRE
jgi:hypothetical protein